MPWLPRTPSAPPMSAIRTDSATTRPITCRLVKPRVLRTPISFLRSRTAIDMVLATTSRMVKVTARPIPLRRRARFPAMATKLAAKAFSVSVRVWASEFSKRASMAALTVPAWSGSSISTE